MMQFILIDENSRKQYTRVRNNKITTRIPMFFEIKVFSRDNRQNNVPPPAE